MTLERAREALGSVGCAIPGKTAEGLEAGHDRDREREPEVTTAPVACPHCGGVLRLIREIPRRQEPLSTRAPAGCAATPRRRTMNTCARFGSAQRGPRRTGQLVLAGSRQAASIVSRRFCENEEPEPTARPAESALSFHHPQLIAPA